MYINSLITFVDVVICTLPPLQTNGTEKKVAYEWSFIEITDGVWVFARNLRNTIVPNQNSMCCPTMGWALSSAASIGLVF